MKFLDLFEPVEKGNYALTDECIYNSIDMSDDFIPIWGGNSNHEIINKNINEKAKNKKGASITIFSGEGIIISLDGSAGAMTYKTGQRFSLNHHAGFIKEKKTLKKEISLRYFSIFFQNKLKSLAVSDGSKTLTLDSLYELEIEIPGYEDQIKIMKKVEPLLKLKVELGEIVKNIDVLKNKYFLMKKAEKFIDAGKIIKHVSRNDSLSEEGIYNKSNNLKPGDKTNLTVLSGSFTKEYGVVPVEKKIHHLSNSFCLQVITRGKAGSIKFLDKGNYATNTNSMLLYLLDEGKKIFNLNSEHKEKIFLKFLKLYLEPKFKEFSSSADLGVLPLTEVLKEINIPLIKVDISIEKIVEKYELIDDYENRIKFLMNKIDNLIDREVRL